MKIGPAKILEGEGPAILILTNHLCESGFPAAKNLGKMPLTQYFLIKPTL